MCIFHKWQYGEMVRSVIEKELLFNGRIHTGTMGYRLKIEQKATCLKCGKIKYDFISEERITSGYKERLRRELDMKSSKEER